MPKPETRPQRPWTEENWTVCEYGDGDSLVIHSDAVHRVCFMATPGESPGAPARIAAYAAAIAALPSLYRSLADLRKHSGAAMIALMQQGEEGVAMANALNRADAAARLALRAANPTEEEEGE